MQEVVSRRYRKIVTEQPRIVSMVPSLTELLCDLQLSENLVGCTKFCVHPAKITGGITKFGGTKCLDSTAILDLEPTHIIMNIDENKKELFKLFEEKNIEVIVTHPQTPLDNLALFDVFGKIFFRQELSNLLSNQFKDRFFRLKERSHSRKKKNVLYLIWRKPWMTVSKDTYISRMLALINWNTIEVCSNKRYPVVDNQELLSHGLDTVLLSSEPYPFKKKHISEIKNLGATCRDISLVDGELLSWYGSRSLLGLEYLNEIATKGSACV